MSYFIYDGVLSTGEEHSMSGEEVHHLLNGRRMREGESFELQDQNLQHFLVVLQKTTRREVFFRVEKQLDALPPSPLQLEILLGMPKEKALDLVIQKITEMGASTLYIFQARFSPKNTMAQKREKTLERWNRIAQAACKQSGRQRPPKIEYFPSLELLLQNLPPSAHQWVLSTQSSDDHAGASDLLNLRSEASDSHRVLIGPEGGLHPDEEQLSIQQGMQPIHIGPRVLRSETAAIAMVAILQFLWGDMRNTIGLSQ